MLRVGVVGAGLIGSRRAREAAAHPESTVTAIADVRADHAQREAANYGARAYTQWRDLVNDPDIDVVIAATPNSFLAEIAVSALHAGKHVLIEKPMGRDLTDARLIYAASQQSKGRLKIGFNHRYHPAITQAYELCKNLTIGTIINIRARYGHGGRPGYEKEWRGNPELAGGGELTDQGVHLADLIFWFAGLPSEAFCYVQTAIWPIAPLEDNAFALFRYENGAIASFHSSWTQWKNLFSFEVFGSGGSISIEGLGKSYGPERLTTARRVDGEPPEMNMVTFGPEDVSWQREWADFIGGIAGKPYWGQPEEGLRAMEMIDALYRSAQQRSPVAIESSEAAR